MVDVAEVLPEGKFCSKCKEYKTAEHFGMHKGKLRSQCKSCEKAYYEENKDKVLARSKSNYNKNKEKRTKQIKEYREVRPVWYKEHTKKQNDKNKEKRSAQAKAKYATEEGKKLSYERGKSWREKPEVKLRNKVKGKEYREIPENKERIKVKNKKWVKENPEKVKAITQRRRAKKMNAEGSYTSAELEALFIKQGGKCHYCSNDISNYYEADHAQPLSRNGSNWIENIRLTCMNCNRSKHNKTEGEFFEYLAKKDKYETIELLKHWRI